MACWNLTANTMADTSMPSSGAGGWRRKSEEYITNKSSALFTSRIHRIENQISYKNGHNMIFSRKKKERGDGIAQQQKQGGRQGGLLIYCMSLCIHTLTLCILVALTEGDCECGYMVVVG